MRIDRASLCHYLLFLLSFNATVNEAASKEKCLFRYWIKDRRVRAGLTFDVLEIPISRSLNCYIRCRDRANVVVSLIYNQQPATLQHFCARKL